MRMLEPVVAALLILVASDPMSAQAHPVSSAIRNFAQSNGKHLLAAAQAMPADKYGYRPTKAQMTFGELIAHIQHDNHTTCSAFSGAKPPAESNASPTDSKEKLVAALERSLTFCNSALARLSDANVGDPVSWYGEKTTRVTAAIGLLTDWADHYGQQAIYLRLNGLRPPTARK
jgi:uncharacterized damage-inducible protein DinB